MGPITEMCCDCPYLFEDDYICTFWIELECGGDNLEIPIGCPQGHKGVSDDKVQDQDK